MNDKVLLASTDKMIRGYLNEEPILRSLRTERFNHDEKKSQVDPQLFADVFGNLDRWVIKRVFGAGGAAVWIGPKMKDDAEAREKLKSSIQKTPWHYIAQEYVQSSRLNGYMLDLRPFAFVTPQEVLVTDQPYSRGSSPDGNGKHNLGSNIGRAMETVPFFLES